MLCRLTEYRLVGAHELVTCRFRVPPGMAVRVHYNNADVTARCRGFHPAPSEYLQHHSRGRRDLYLSTGVITFRFRREQGAVLGIRVEPHVRPRQPALLWFSCASTRRRSPGWQKRH